MSRTWALYIPTCLLVLSFNGGKVDMIVSGEIGIVGMPFGYGAEWALHRTAPDLSIGSTVVFAALGGTPQGACWLRWDMKPNNGPFVGAISLWDPLTCPDFGPCEARYAVGPPGVMLGWSFRLTAGSFWVGVNPSITVIPLGGFNFYPPAGFMVGPAFLEAGWQVAPHLELSLRATTFPVMAAFSF
ncbi:MAG: hypothetical protein JWM80_2427 [Cyanobacteria bacterium RYN_339]|nr:hypothetical protein [Cyanobacteria bacterium RYN_339]